jgi:hypothetical protein
VHYITLSDKDMSPASKPSKVVGENSPAYPSDLPESRCTFQSLAYKILLCLSTIDRFNFRYTEYHMLYKGVGTVMHAGRALGTCFRCGGTQKANTSRKNMNSSFGEAQCRTVLHLRASRRGTMRKRWHRQHRIQNQRRMTGSGKAAQRSLRRRYQPLRWVGGKAHTRKRYAEAAGRTEGGAGRTCNYVILQSIRGCEDTIGFA